MLMTQRHFRLGAGTTITAPVKVARVRQKCCSIEQVYTSQSFSGQNQFRPVTTCKGKY